MTIKRKLISIIMLACITSLFLVGAAFISWQWFSIRQQMIQNLSTQAKMIADNCKATIAFDDTKDATEALQTLKAEPSIVFGSIYTIDGKVFASFYRDEIDTKVGLSEPQINKYSFDDEFLTVSEPIFLDGERIGTTCLRSDLVPLYTTLKRNISVIVIVLLLVSLPAYFISSILQRIISGPILDLADVTKAVSENKEYSVRAQNNSKDEIGSLIDAFNGMLEQIQQRDLALVNTNEQLEQKVDERTVELRKEIVVREKTEKALAETVKKLTRSTRELQEFTRVSAHDLQTPLRGIGILSSWISDDYSDKINEEGQGNIKLLATRASRMSKLLDAIIQYSNLTLVDRRGEKLDLNDLLPRVIKKINPPKNIEVNIENELPTFTAVREFIKLVFENLIGNAVKYMDKPKGQIRIACVESNGFWQFSVADNGPGIEERYFDKIFQIFQILSFRDETENIGIGLPVVKKIIELYEGQIWVESEPGQGSTFFFTLPKEESRVALCDSDGVMNPDFNPSTEVGTTLLETSL